MDNSDIWYYVAAGAIYFLSRIFGKKKPKPKRSLEGKEEQREAQTPTLEDVFRELTGEAMPATEPETWERPLETDEEPTAEEMDALASAVEEMPAPKYERAEHFRVEEEDHTFKEELHDLLSSYDGLKKAVVLKELLDRKY